MSEKIKFRDNTDNIVVLTVSDLDDLIFTASYRAANKACTSLYGGLTNAFLDRFDDDLRALIKEVEQIKLRLDNLNMDKDDGK